MEILIGIMPLIIFVIYYVIISIQEWITDTQHLRELIEHPEFFSRTYDVSADEIRKALCR